MVPKKDGKGRICSCEIMIGTSGIRNLVREGKTHQLATLIQSGKRFGMQTLDKALADLVLAKEIREEDAIEKAIDPKELQKMIRGGYDY